MNSSLTARLRSIVAEQIEAGLAPGVELFVSQNGEVVVDDAVGTTVPDGGPLTRDTRLCVWSASKPVTAMALHQVVERGLVAYPDAVARHIPEFCGDGREAVTVRHLLLHQAGIPDAAAVAGPDAHRDPVELIKVICGLPLESVPGAEVSYHPMTASALLAEIVRRVDGRPLEEFCAAEIFGPLGMTRSTWGLAAQHYGEASSNVRVETGDLLDFATNALATAVVPGANVWTTAADLGRFYECWRQGGEWQGARLLSRATVEHASRLHVTTPGLPMFGLGYGFFVGTAPEANPSRGVLCSEKTFGHPGATCSVAFCDPVHDLVVVFIANGSPSQPVSDRRFGILCDEVYRSLT